VEVTNAPVVSILHSEFPDASAGSFSLDRVRTFKATNSIIRRDAVRIRGPDRNATEVDFVCAAEDVLAAAEDGGACVGPVGRRDLSEPRSSADMGDSGFAGAIALAAVSCALLLAAVGGLLFAHRTGKLEPYI